MEWTCPKGHARTLVTDLAQARQLVAVLALTSFCQDCETSYLLTPETQHRVLQKLEERQLRETLPQLVIRRGRAQWMIKFVRLRLVARFPPDAAELEVIADAGDDAPRIRLIARVSLDVLRASALLERKLLTLLERQLSASDS